MYNKIKRRLDRKKLAFNEAQIFFKVLDTSSGSRKKFACVTMVITGGSYNIHDFSSLKVNFLKEGRDILQGGSGRPPSLLDIHSK